MQAKRVFSSSFFLLSPEESHFPEKSRRKIRKYYRRKVPSQREKGEKHSARNAVIIFCVSTVHKVSLVLRDKLSVYLSFFRALCKRKRRVSRSSEDPQERFFRFFFARRKVFFVVQPIYELEEKEKEKSCNAALTAEKKKSSFPEGQKKEGSKNALILFVA